MFTPSVSSMHYEIPELQLGPYSKYLIVLHAGYNASQLKVCSVTAGTEGIRHIIFSSV